MSSYVQKHMSLKESKEFEKWAFGEDFSRDCRLELIPKKWNALHGDKFLIDGKNPAIDDVKKMVEIYKQEKGLS
jgi:hypothetical protein